MFFSLCVAVIVSAIEAFEILNPGMDQKRFDVIILRFAERHNFCRWIVPMGIHASTEISPSDL